MEFKPNGKLTKTKYIAHVVQTDGYYYERRVWTDGIMEFIKVNGDWIYLYDFEKRSFIKSIEQFYSPVGE